MSAPPVDDVLASGDVTVGMVVLSEVVFIFLLWVEGFEKSVLVEVEIRDFPDCEQSRH